MYVKIDRDKLWEILFFLKNECQCRQPKRLKKHVDFLSEVLNEYDKKEMLRRIFTLYKTESDEKRKDEYLKLYLEVKNNEF